MKKTRQFVTILCLHPQNCLIKIRFSSRCIHLNQKITISKINSLFKIPLGYSSLSNFHSIDHINFLLLFHWFYPKIMHFHNNNIPPFNPPANPVHNVIFAGTKHSLVDYDCFIKIYNFFLLSIAEWMAMAYRVGLFLFDYISYISTYTQNTTLFNGFWCKTIFGLIKFLFIVVSNIKYFKL